METRQDPETWDVLQRQREQALEDLSPPADQWTEHTKWHAEQNRKMRLFRAAQQRAARNERVAEAEWIIERDRLTRASRIADADYEEGESTLLYWCILWFLAGALVVGTAWGTSTVWAALHTVIKP